MKAMKWIAVISLLLFTGTLVMAAEKKKKPDIKLWNEVFLQVDKYRLDREKEKAIEYMEDMWSEMDFGDNSGLCESYIFAWLALLFEKGDLDSIKDIYFSKMEECNSKGFRKILPVTEPFTRVADGYMYDRAPDRQPPSHFEFLPTVIECYRRALPYLEDWKRDEVNNKIEMLQQQLVDYNNRGKTKSKTEYTSLTIPNPKPGERDEYKESMKEPIEKILRTMEQAVITNDYNLFKSLFAKEPYPNVNEYFNQLYMKSLSFGELGIITAEKYTTKTNDSVSSKTVGSFRVPYSAIYDDESQREDRMTGYLCLVEGVWKIEEIESFYKMTKRGY